ncbi:hypothetical protein SEMRO_911_G219240.1 [Seminavis robusta]|uniref:Uncharacterized protein n=1 Tax=Seminavis robusta TaxID=568900 RepID=A0A9N8EGI6_9STRA|nr:hypothetical protein SEMRO_911_G219240.1 [Seminavis robusta]|eukprot:Sro911_g219240.1 n/a (262) ;mRNA; f:23300-24085
MDTSEREGDTGNEDSTGIDHNEVETQVDTTNSGSGVELAAPDDLTTEETSDIGLPCRERTYASSDEEPDDFDPLKIVELRLQAMAAQDHNDIDESTVILEQTSSGGRETQCGEDDSHDEIDMLKIVQARIDGAMTDANTDGTQPADDMAAVKSTGKTRQTDVPVSVSVEQPIKRKMPKRTKRDLSNWLFWDQAGVLKQRIEEFKNRLHRMGPIPYLLRTKPKLNQELMLGHLARGKGTSMQHPIARDQMSRRMAHLIQCQT